MGHILTNSYTEAIFQITIHKCDVSDHFPACLIMLSLKFLPKNKFIYIYKISFDEQSIIKNKKKKKHFQNDWQEIQTLQTPRDAYRYFYNSFWHYMIIFFPL